MSVGCRKPHLFRDKKMLGGQSVSPDQPHEVLTFGRERSAPDSLAEGVPKVDSHAQRVGSSSAVGGSRIAKKPAIRCCCQESSPVERRAK